MSRISFILKPEQSEKLAEALKKTSSTLESKLNEYLHTKGGQHAIQGIIGFIPKSNRQKKHAKDSNPLKFDKLNLGFKVYARGGAANKKGSFGYLVFPDEGRGSHNFIAQEFFRRGLESKEDKLFNDVIKIIDENISI